MTNVKQRRKARMMIMSPIKKKLILASKSPWRKRLLKKHGISCLIHASSFKELRIHKNPRALALYNACGKARDVSKHHKNAIVIGVDTIGVLGEKIILKPRNRTHARHMLLELAGKTHRVISGLCVFDCATKLERTAVAVTKVTFRKILPRELREYLDSGQWEGKAGAYAIQGRAKKFVAKIDGDITNVIGLPINVLKRLLFA